MANELAKKKCIPCQGGVPPLKGKDLEDLRSKLDEEWEVVDEHHLRKEYSFDNFKQALDFTNRLGAVAEDENHHPDIHLAYGRAVVEIWTHKIDGLTESDFILAAKSDEVI